ncbi:S-layer homology domain-containing protein [Lysinibacillus sp. NPDC097231]|uniref:S-layer homology domain-containing protein n=1 Tax=Lysinibacillus sp. NPDC097231 TaxID=3364142 RepID=UPI0037F56F87
MKKQMKVAALSTLLLSSLAMPTVSFANEPTEEEPHAVAIENFHDVDKNHYAYEAIKWAQQQGIVSGYTDSKGRLQFGPNDSVTEAQFAKMISEFLQLKDYKGNLAVEKATWSDLYYDVLVTYEVPLNGYKNNVARNQPVKRGLVAQTISYVTNGNTNLDYSISYLMNQGITVGENPDYKNSNLQKYFGSENVLTRAQIVTFLYRMNNTGINQLHDTLKVLILSEKPLEQSVSEATLKIDKSLLFK